jgi:hypothetical protein
VLTFLTTALLLAGSAGAVETCEESVKETAHEVHRLHKEISFLNLINGLNLTREQLTALRDVVRKAVGLRHRTLAENGQMAKDLAAALRALRSDLVRGSRPGREVERRAALLNHRMRDLRIRNMKKLPALEKELGGILTDGQKEILAGFIPCLIPPRDLRNPERAGQAADHSRAADLLARLRRVPPRDREHAVRRAAERIAAKLSQHTGGLSAEQRRAEVERVSRELRKALAADDVEFALKKTEFAKNIKPAAFKPKADRRLYSQGGRYGPPRPGKIARFFFTPEALRVLEGRLRAEAKEEPAVVEKRVGT